MITVLKSIKKCATINQIYQQEDKVVTEKNKTDEKAAENGETPEAAQPAEDKIGGILKQARLGKGKKIQDVAQVLCIRKAYLEAIETNDYEKIPPFPYGIGFIRSYADYLGLNSSLIIQKYKEETEPESAENENTGYVPEPQAEAAVPGKKYLTISLLAIIAVYAAWHFYSSYKSLPENAVSDVEKESIGDETATDENQYPLVVEDFSMNEGDTSAPVPQEENLPVIEPAPVEESAQVNVTDASFEEEPAAAPQSEPETTVSEPAAPTAVEPAPAAEPVQEPKAAAKPAVPGKSNIVFEIKKETWIEVKTADKLYLSKVLYAGDSYTLPKAKGLIVSVGRFDGVETFIDGKPVDFLPKDRKMNIDLEAALAKVNRKL